MSMCKSLSREEEDIALMLIHWSRHAEAYLLTFLIVVGLWLIVTSTDNGLLTLAGLLMHHGH